MQYTGFFAVQYVLLSHMNEVFTFLFIYFTKMSFLAVNHFTGRRGI